MQPIIVINCNLLIQIKGDDCHSMLTIPSNGDVFFYYLYMNILLIIKKDFTYIKQKKPTNLKFAGISPKNIYTLMFSILYYL